MFLSSIHSVEISLQSGNLEVTYTDKNESPHFSLVRGLNIYYLESSQLLTERQYMDWNERLCQPGPGAAPLRSADLWRADGDN